MNLMQKNCCITAIAIIHNGLPILYRFGIANIVSGYIMEFWIKKTIEIAINILEQELSRLGLVESTKLRKSFETGFKLM